uniref:Putative dna polymerase iii subunit gamma and tau n=1 Tax=Ixodes ricinus TaxID=34613 RepID=A0A147BBL7_IXORI
MTTHAYVRYIEDNEQAVVAIQNIKDFRPRGPEDFNDKAKYNVKWGSDDEYYKARILLLGASEEDVRRKLQTARLRIKKVIESSDYSDEDAGAMEKENVKAQKKNQKEKLGTSTRVDLMKILEQKQKKMAATQHKSTNPGEVEEKLKRAERQIAQLEKELWQKDRELEKLRYLNMRLQENIIEKFESWKAPNPAHATAATALAHTPAVGAAAAAPPSIAAVALPHAAPSSAAVPAAMALPAVSPLAPAATVAVAVSVAPAPAPAAVALPEVPAPAPLHVALPGVGDPPAGVRHHIVENGMVDVGSGIHFTAVSWMTVCDSKKNSIWVKELAVAMFGDRVLLESCVNGKHSSKFPGRPPKPGLCPHRMGVLKDMYQARLQAQGMPRDLAFTLRKDVTGRINEKIGDLRKLEKRRLQAAAAADTEDHE